MTESRFGKAFSEYGGKLLTWLMCAVSMSLVIYIYTESPFNGFTLLAAAMSAGLVFLFDYLRTKKFGGLIYLALLIIAGLIPGALLGGENARPFVIWFFSGAQAEETREVFLLALTLLLGFFLTSAVYYFTRIIYRSLMLVLVSLIPFAIAVKTAVNPPYAYAAVMAALNLTAFITDGRKNILKGAKVSGGSALTVYTDFAAAAVLLALLVPKPSVTPYFDRFEEFANRFQFGGTGETSYRGVYRSSSGNADEYLKGESRLLYIISTADPVYMKAQVFDHYDREKRCWTVQLDDVQGTKYWQEQRPLLSYEKLAEAVEKAVEYDSSFLEFYPQAEKLSEITEKESFSIVYARDYPAVYVLAPLRATEASLVNTGAEYSARTDSGEIFTNLRALPANGDYTIRYYSESVFKKLINGGFCDVSSDDYRHFLYRILWQFDTKSDEFKVIDEFAGEQRKAEEYRDKTATEVSPEIQALADEITAGLEYDYQKAQAIEDYFQSGKYIYSLAYEVPEELDTPEYFIFESRTGTCSDFATAYTLLARASGLAVRYVEGFVPQPSGSEDSGIYIINTENAHAYPEVYIPGAGWVIYEPTAADLTGGNRSDDDNNGEPDYIVIFLTAIVVVLGIGIFILLVILTPKFMECIFRIKVKHKGGGRAVIMLYNRHIRNLEAKTGTGCKALTPEQLAAVTEEKTEVSLEPLTKPFIDACYGETEIDDFAFEEAYNCYKEQAKALRKRNRKRRKE